MLLGRKSKVALCLCGLMLTASLATSALLPSSDEPISYIGHGAMLDKGGVELAPTLRVIGRAQSWYLQMLTQRLSVEDGAKFAQLQRRLTKDESSDVQARLVVESRLLEWLVHHAKIEKKAELLGKLALLRSKLRYVRVADGSAPASAATLYELPSQVSERLRGEPELKALASKSPFLAVTGVSGEAYRKLCSEHGVPLPPDFGPGSAWQSQGVIDAKDLFLERGMNAEVLTYTSASPAGLCIALPRFDDKNIVQADGVVCLGQVDPLDAKRAKVCFWDNQDPNKPELDSQFTFPRGSVQPISQFAGGSDLRAKSGGVCSSCHAGENPYVIHGTVLNGVSTKFATLIFAKTWYEPIVRTGDTEPWPENPGPIAAAPNSCTKCHAEEDAGRLPALSPALKSYCSTVLRSAVGARAPPLPDESGTLAANAPPSMPPTRPGSYACTPNIPAGDPRYVQCTAAHTTACTPNFADDDPRKGDRLYEVKCTSDLASVLAQCEVPLVAFKRPLSADKALAVSAAVMKARK